MPILVARRLSALLPAALLAALVAQPPAVAAAEPPPLPSPAAEEATGEPVARLSKRTLTLAIEVDRDGARLLSYTLKDRPFVRPLKGAVPESDAVADLATIELILLGPDGARHVEQVDARALCFLHEADAPPHIRGDRIEVHRESLIVEVPEIAGFDRIEVARYEPDGLQNVRRLLGSDSLDQARFTPAGGGGDYKDLAIAAPTSGESLESVTTAGTVHWPEEYSDPDVYRIYGNASEIDRRINIVLVPDGYTYAEKATLNAHADAMVAAFRSRTPYAEHDRFFNYILVYAYSTQTGTDQCDCNIVTDTAMGSGFPNAGYPCGDSGNRCLYYGWGCDTAQTGNIVAAELRAPARDATVVLVNTPRYGGCGGDRAVYSAANPVATEIALHEVGHSVGSLADEYAGDPGCGTFASEINTSLNSFSGAWPEWIATIGAPKLGADYYEQCVYRPETNCEMRALNQPFCKVCNQQWARTIFGHFRVSPTAPVASFLPALSVEVTVQNPPPFTVTTRLATGATNTFTWSLQGPGFPTPTVVATGVTTYTPTLSVPGDYTLTCLVVADTNFIKPVKNSANVDQVVWAVHAVDATVDGDGDGISIAQGDCDDHRITVYPGAPQICDGLHNNCLGPGWPTVPATEIDDDLDQYRECEGDCNDAVAAVHPGAPEAGCDGVDNDCSGATPDVRDGDGDTFACDTDCDDADPATYPNAPESNESTDNQCGPGEAGYGLVDEISGLAAFPDLGDSSLLCWPAQPGAEQYKVIRSLTRNHAGGCASIVASGSCAVDPEVPASRGVYYYLVRSLRPTAGSLGRGSGGAERQNLCGAESTCGNALDDDLDGRADCTDPDCLAAPACPGVTLTFTNTVNDDIPDLWLAAFLASADVFPSDYIHLRVQESGSNDFQWCSERADFYRQGYLAFGPTFGEEASGNWNKWYRDEYSAWLGPTLVSYPSYYGDFCLGPYSWCPEYLLGDRGIAVWPGDGGDCEALDVGSGCGPGDTLTLWLGRDRFAACGF